MEYQPIPVAAPQGVASYPTVQPIYVPSSGGGSGKKIVGVIILVIAFLLIAGLIGVVVYFATRKGSDFKPFSGGGKCNNGSITVPEATVGVSPPDGVTCYTLSGYNTYSRATIKSPAVTAENTLFKDQTTFGSAKMTGELCTDKCDAVSGCVAATCKYSKGVTNNCSCSGYNVVPTALAADPCTDGCNYVYVSSEHVG